MACRLPATTLAPLADDLESKDRENEQRQHPGGGYQRCEQQGQALARHCAISIRQCLEEIVGSEHGVLDPHVDDGEMVPGAHERRGWVFAQGGLGGRPIARVQR